MALISAIAANELVNTVVPIASNAASNAASYLSGLYTDLMNSDNPEAVLAADMTGRGLSAYQAARRVNPAYAPYASTAGASSAFIDYKLYRGPYARFRPNSTNVTNITPSMIGASGAPMIGFTSTPAAPLYDPGAGARSGAFIPTRSRGFGPVRVLRRRVWRPPVPGHRAVPRAGTQRRRFGRHWRGIRGLSGLMRSDLPSTRFAMWAAVILRRRPWLRSSFVRKVPHLMPLIDRLLFFWRGRSARIRRFRSRLRYVS